MAFILTKLTKSKKIIKFFFFSGPATKREGGGHYFPQKNVATKLGGRGGKKLVAGPFKNNFIFCGFPWNPTERVKDKLQWEQG